MGTRWTQRGSRSAQTVYTPTIWSSFDADRLTCVDVAARIPEDQAARAGIAPDQVKIKEKYGGGYPAHVEGLHHLHCLVRTAKTRPRDAILMLEQNLLRKSLPWNIEYYRKQGLGPFSNKGDVLKHHTSEDHSNSCLIMKI